MQFVLWMTSHSILDRWESDHTSLSHALETTDCIKCKIHLTLTLRSTRMCNPFHHLSWDPSSRSKAVGSKVTMIAISLHYSQMLSKELNTGSCNLCLTKMTLKGPKHRLLTTRATKWVYESFTDGNVIYRVLGLHATPFFLQSKQQLSLLIDFPWPFRTIELVLDFFMTSPLWVLGWSP